MGRKEGGGMQFGALSLIARGGGYFESLREGRGGGCCCRKHPCSFPFIQGHFRIETKSFVF